MVPLDRAEELLVEVETAAEIAARLERELASERERCERIYAALAELVGQERAEQIVSEEPPRPQA